MKLKTLEDMEETFPKGRVSEGLGFCLTDKLKREAIKHWKHAQKVRDKNDNQEIDLKYQGVQSCLEFFFNIKSEDLQ